MVISFHFKNFRSFREEAFIDMKAVSYKEHPSHLILADNKKLIKTLAIYGANASGKSNLLLAFASFHSLIFWQLFSLKAIPKNHFMALLELSKMNQIIPFQSDGPDSQPTEMELSFLSGGHIYDYGFSVCGQKILTEYMSVDHHSVFTRNHGELTIGRFYEKILRQKFILQPHDNRLFCSVLTCLDIPEFTEIIEPFESFFSEHIDYYFDLFEPAELWGRTALDTFPYKILENTEGLDYCLAHLRKLGIPVEDIIIEQGHPKLGYRIKSRKNSQSEVRYMDITQVSSGTIKYLTLFMKIYYLSKKGGVLIVDNISNEFHPAVTKSIIDSFQKERNHHVQLLFTTYDTSILNNQQFRRDEVAFVDMNDYQESRLYTLADIKVRSDASFSKDYLLGKYGAIPIFRDSL